MLKLVYSATRPCSEQLLPPSTSSLATFCDPNRSPVYRATRMWLQFLLLTHTDPVGAATVESVLDAMVSETRCAASLPQTPS